MRVPLTPLQQLALTELRRHGEVTADVLRIEFRNGLLHCTVNRQLSTEDLEAPGMPNSTNDRPPPRAGKWHSPIEESILAVATKDWQSAAALAEKTGQKCGHWFYAILGNLVDRDFLESGRNGYRLIAPPRT